jgi:hypothetical protein
LAHYPNCQNGARAARATAYGDFINGAGGRGKLLTFLNLTRLKRLPNPKNWLVSLILREPLAFRFLPPDNGAVSDLSERGPLTCIE